MVGTIYKNVYNPEAAALKFKDSTITYKQLDESVTGYADYFRKMGLRTGERVILSCTNSPEFIFSYFGVVRNGGIIVPINLLLTMEEIAYLIKDSEAKMMIVHPLILQKAKITKDKNSNKIFRSFQATVLRILTTGMQYQVFCILQVPQENRRQPC